METLEEVGGARWRRAASSNSWTELELQPVVKKRKIQRSSVSAQHARRRYSIHLPRHIVVPDFPSLARSALMRKWNSLSEKRTMKQMVEELATIDLIIRMLIDVLLIKFDYF